MSLEKQVPVPDAVVFCPCCGGFAKKATIHARLGNIKILGKTIEELAVIVDEHQKMQQERF